ADDVAEAAGERGARDGRLKGGKTTTEWLRGCLLARIQRVRDSRSRPSDGGRPLLAMLGDRLNDKRGRGLGSAHTGVAATGLGRSTLTRTSPRSSGRSSSSSSWRGPRYERCLGSRDSRGGSTRS